MQILVSRLFDLSTVSRATLKNRKMGSLGMRLLNSLEASVVQFQDISGHNVHPNTAVVGDITSLLVGCAVKF